MPARCGDRGFLLIGADLPDMGGYVLPGNNYHVYDYALFWTNIRADAEARLATFVRARSIPRRPGCRRPNFARSLLRRGRRGLLGLDVGTKTIGLALVRCAVDDRHAGRAHSARQIRG